MTIEREAMTLEQVRDALRLGADYNSTGGYSGKLLSVADMEHMADAIDAHLSRAADEETAKLKRLIWCVVQSVGHDILLKRNVVDDYNHETSIIGVTTDQHGGSYERVWAIHRATPQPPATAQEGEHA